MCNEAAWAVNRAKNTDVEMSRTGLEQTHSKNTGKDKLRGFVRAYLFVGAAAILGACSTGGPADVSKAELSNEANFQRQLALEDLVANQRRIEEISFRLMTAAAEFCGERKVRGFGFTVANRNSFGKDMVSAAETLYGLDQASRVFSVIPESPASEAGLAPGDIIAQVDDTPVQQGKDSITAIENLLAGSARKTVTLHLAGANPREVELQPREACGYPVEILNVDKVNAYADGQRIRITKGMLWFVNGDAELAMVLSHELAHNVMGHAGVLRSILENKKAREADADYVGLYIMARAGFDIEQAPNFWRRIAAAFPRMIESSASHPVMPYRFVALRKTTEEIRLLEANGHPLVPRGVESLPVGRTTAVLPE